MSARWARELALGARLARAWRGGRTRLLLTALGVGLGVALLLLAASLPNVLDARHAVESARDDMQLTEGPTRRGPRSLLVAHTGTTFRDIEIRGRLLRAEGARPPLPPGVARFPRAGELVVSPRLAALLRSDDGALLRQRLGGRVIGEIGSAGLLGPAEYAYYGGSDRLRYGGLGVRRIDHFGGELLDDGNDEVLALLAAVAFAALLLPVAIFIAAAARFGGELRDRRLAALRLAGADAAMLRRVAAGEALLGASLGLLVGVALFLLARQLGEHVELRGFSAFATDVRPQLAWTVAIVVLVPVGAVAVTQTALRSVVVEPLGVARQRAVGKRSAWWRWLLLLGGIALPVVYGGQMRSSVVAVVLVLTAVAALLPWSVEVAARRAVRVPIGGLSWQFAVRRLQLDAATSARVVSGVVVAVAGAVALQTVFAGVESEYTTERAGSVRADGLVEIGSSPGRDGPSPERLERSLRKSDSVGQLLFVRTTWANSVGRRNDVDINERVRIGDCAALRAIADLPSCRDGDSFAVDDNDVPAGEFVPHDGVPALRPGERVSIGEEQRRWRIPATAGQVPARIGLTGDRADGLLLTPRAAATLPPGERGAIAYVRLDTAVPDALERVRNVVAGVDPMLALTIPQERTTAGDYARLRTWLSIGVVAVLTLIGTSMLVGALDQLRERRRQLAALAAMGTPRALLARSLLWQAALPVGLGLVFAVAAGCALGVLLLRALERPIAIDVGAIAVMVTAGAAVVLVVTAATLPALRRLTRPEGLRTE